ncbi:histidine kinase [Phyllobacterium sp. SYP-B3895]|nr:histidine kinase [Phyllobacterium sp. SYP-B3895]
MQAKWRQEIKAWFGEKSLSTQFALAGGVFMLGAMFLAGSVVSNIVSKVTIEDTASATALFLQSLITPLVHDLATVESLSAEQIQRLDALLGGDEFSKRFPHLEIWKDDGLIVYSRSAEIIGRRFTAPHGLVDALAGEVSAQYADLSAAEHTVREFNKSYLEIYVPIRELLSGDIIAVAEIHEVPSQLEEKLTLVQRRTWLAIVAATLLIVLGLFGIVYRGSRLIDVQKAGLVQRLKKIEQISEHNRCLRERSQQASSRVAEFNERALRNIGADLHDGPAQLITLAALKLDEVHRAPNGAARKIELKKIGGALSEALDEIRSISKGLMLPDIEKLALSDLIFRVARSHEQRTNTKVDVDCLPITEPLPLAIKICVYRFVQEGLTNAFRHARGHEQSVTCTFDGMQLNVSVKSGNNLQDRDPPVWREGMGLNGLRDRVESLGGSFQVYSGQNSANRIEMSLDFRT